MDSFAALRQVIERGTNVLVEDEAGQRTKGKVIVHADSTLQLMCSRRSRGSVGLRLRF